MPATTEGTGGAVLDVPVDSELPDLSGLPGVASVESGSSESEVVYTDTGALALAAAGIQLSRRADATGRTWTLRLPTNREDVRVGAFDASTDDAVPDSLAGLIRLATRGEPLLDVVTIRTTRTSVRLLDAAGSLRAEVSDDHVVALSVFPEDAATMRAWRHWTVLAGSGEPPLSQEVGARLVSSGATTADVPDLQRALGRRWPVAPQPPRVGSEGSATEVVLATLAELNDELRRHDPLVRAERHDAVHRMRVTTRRLRSVLATFRPLLDRGLTDSLREELQWFAGLLGGARDAEVLSRRIIRELDDQPAQQVRGPVRAFVDQELRARYEEHHQRCVQAMTSSRYFDLVDRLDALVVHPRWSDRAESAGPDLLRARVRHNLRRLDRRIAGVKLALDDDERTHRLHDVRKAAKRARYSAEALQPTYGRDAQRLAKSMRRVQRVLGEHQDTVVARHELQRLSDRATAAGVNGYSFGVLERVLAQAGATAQSRLDDVWRRAARPKRRAWLQG